LQFKNIVKEKVVFKIFIQKDTYNLIIIDDNIHKKNTLFTITPNTYYIFSIEKKKKL
jgi:hypothetical protein